MQVCCSGEQNCGAEDCNINSVNKSKSGNESCMVGEIKYKSTEGCICCACNLSSGHYCVHCEIKGVDLQFTTPMSAPLWYQVKWKRKQSELSLRAFKRSLLLPILNKGYKLNLSQKQYLVSFTSSLQSDIPVPRIHNCGKNVDSPVIYYVNQEIDLTSDMFFTNENHVNLTLKDEWKIERKIYFRWSAVRAESNTQSQQQSEYNFIGKHYWRISPFSWKHGLYIVKLEVSAINLVPSHNFGQCYLKVELQPLLAFIEGGIQRTVNTEEDLVMNPSGSQDPNQPLEQGTLRFTLSCNWTDEEVCQEVYREGILYDSGLSKPSFHYSVKSHHLREDRLYNFTLKVETRNVDYQLNPAYFHQLVTAKHFPLELPSKSFEIECVYNCHKEVNPQEIIYLKLNGNWQSVGNLSKDIQWRVFEEKQEIINSSVIRSNANNTGFDFPHIFIVAEDQLKESSLYLFEVSLNNTDLKAIYELSTTKSVEVQCLVEPDSKFSLLTLFKITCNSSGFVESYEFYNKHNGSVEDFNGRMLGYRKTGEIDGVILAEDIVSVIAYGKHRIKTKTTNIIHIQNESVNIMESSPLKNDYWNMLDWLAFEGNIDLLSRASAFVELSKFSEDTMKDLLRILTLLNKVQLHTSSDVKLCTSTLYSILTKQQALVLNLEEALQTAVNLDTITKTLTRGMKHQFTFSEYYDIFRNLIDSINAVIRADLGESAEYQELKYLLQVERIKKHALNTIRQMGMTLLSNHLPDQEAAIMKSADENIVFIVPVTQPIHGDTLFKDMWTTKNYHYATGLKYINFTIPGELSRLWKQTGYYVGLQALLVKNWWKGDVKTYVLQLQICYRQEIHSNCIYPHWLGSAVWVNFYIYNLTKKLKFCSLNVTRLNELKPPEELDSEMKMLRIDLLPGACVYVEFSLANKEDELVVYIRKSIRPSYNDVERKGVIIRHGGNYYKALCETLDQPRQYYLGIIAGERVPLHSVLSFDYKFVYRRCVRWDERLQKWESHGSLIGKKDQTTPAHDLTCKWARVGVFAAEVDLAHAVVADKIDLFLFFTPWSNRRAVLECFALSALLFIVVFIASWWVDRRVQCKRFVIVLPDNFPQEKNGYLICVKTGTRISAGTDAKVGVRLHGTDGDSRAHVLHSEKCRGMGWSSECWFQMFTHHHLGTLHSLHIWHDNSGKSPSWFCESILVFDMKKEHCYTFIVNEWIDITAANIPEVFVEPLQLTALTTWSSKFMNHLKYGFCYNHLWIAMVLSHPRDPVRRAGRLMIGIIFILTSVSASLILTVFSEGGRYLEVKEDPPSFSVERRDFLISFLTMIISASVARLMLYILRKSYTVWYCSKEEEKIKVDGFSCRNAQYATLIKKNDEIFSGELTYLSYNSSNLIGVKSCSLLQYIALQFMQQPLIPVQLRGDKPAVSVNIGWRFRFILFYLLVVLQSVFVSVLLSDHLSPNRIRRWVTIVVMSNIIYTVIYLPLKILITSLVLSLSFDRIIYKDFYIHDPADCHKTHLFGNVEHLTNVIEERMKPEYKPMNDSVHKMYQEKKLRIIKWRATMDFVFFILFVIVLCKILNKDNLLPYFTNDHLHSMLGASGDKNLPSFNAVYNLTQFDKFLKQSFSLSPSKFFWYNKKHIQEGRKNQEKKDWCFDNTHRMLRRPHFTLSRVKPGHCQVPGVMQTVSGALECAAPWDRTAEDTQVYKPYWTLPEHLDNTSYWNPGNWSYTHYSNYNHCGRSGRCYPSGGYNRSLWSEARVVLSVRDEGWMDHFTRALLIHLTLCNVNTRRIVPVTLVAEHTVTGEFLNVIVVESRGIVFERDIWIVMFMVFVIIYLTRFLIRLSSAGLDCYFKKVHRLFDLLFLIILLYSFIICTKLCFIQEYFHVDVDIDEDSVFHTFETQNFLFYAQSVLIMIFILSIVNIFCVSHVYNFGRHYLIFVRTLVSSLDKILWLAIFLLLFIIIFNITCYVLNNFVTIIKHKLYQKMSVIGFEAQVLFYSGRLGGYILLKLMLVSFMYEYKHVNKHILEPGVSFNIATFIVQEVRSFCNAYKN